MPPNTETKDPHPQQETKNSTEETGGEGPAIQRVARVARYDRPVMGLPCWPPFVFCFFFNNKLTIEKVAWALCMGITGRGSPTLVTFATITLLKPRLWYFCLSGTSWGAESSR